MSDDINDKDNENGKLFCSFCGKNQDEVRKLIAGPSVFICDECVDLCNDIIREEIQDVEEHESQDRLPIPAEIKDKLDEYVIGQDRAKKYSQSPYTIITSVCVSKATLQVKIKK